MLAIYRDKWREVPGGGDGRYFSDELLALSDQNLLAFWERIAEGKKVVAFARPLYRDYFAGRRILEIGCGLGIEGMRFIEDGADWIFSDIAESNLTLVRRIAAMKGFRADFHFIDDDLAFDGLGEFDAIFACGSLINVPFDLARLECANILPHLKLGGRWIELCYPPERWINEGCLPFEEWGKRTDGERTPWMEWYNIDKLKRRLDSAQFRTVLDFRFGNDAFNWLDMVREG